MPKVKGEEVVFNLHSLEVPSLSREQYIEEKIAEHKIDLSFGFDSYEDFPFIYVKGYKSKIIASKGYSQSKSAYNKKRNQLKRKAR